MHTLDVTELLKNYTQFTTSCPAHIFSIFFECGPAPTSFLIMWIYFYCTYLFSVHYIQFSQPHRLVSHHMAPHHIFIIKNVVVVKCVFNKNEKIKIKMKHTVISHHFTIPLSHTPLRWNIFLHRYQTLAFLFTK